MVSSSSTEASIGVIDAVVVSGSSVVVVRVPDSRMTSL